MSETLPIEEPKIDSENKTNNTDQFQPAPPDFVGNDHSGCAWAKYNVDGEIIVLHIKIGELRFKLRRRFL